MKANDKKLKDIDFKIKYNEDIILFQRANLLLEKVLKELSKNK
jgi:hypothetical protein